jgi:hypothetical protein
VHTKAVRKHVDEIDPRIRKMMPAQEAQKKLEEADKLFDLTE